MVPMYREDWYGYVDIWIFIIDVIECPADL